MKCTGAAEGTTGAGVTRLVALCPRAASEHGVHGYPSSKERLSTSCFELEGTRVHFKSTAAHVQFDLILSDFAGRFFFAITGSVVSFGTNLFSQSHLLGYEQVNIGFS